MDLIPKEVSNHFLPPGFVATHLQSVTHDYSTFTASSEANSYFKFKGEKVVDIGACGTRKASTPNNE